MTEYIVLVGLIALLLVAAVERYKEQIRITIVGSTGPNGLDKATSGMDSNGKKPNKGDTKTFDGKTYTWDGSKWVQNT